MGKINILEPEISNKIAAGEVVERPASVVKELVENSIDAGADKITVEIKNGGNTYIKISDNGCGMERDDAAVAFLRHATSKIKDEEDLTAIYTLGFRGEALSSIGAVAQVDLYTKRAEDETGTHTVCEGGEIISYDDAGIANGTVFIVKNLFYNVPARMKFLKKDRTEAGYITDIMTRFVLAHPEISFRMISNGKEVLFSSGDSNPVNAIYAVYGKDYAKAMLSVDYQSEYVRVTGLIGKGSTARANRNYQSYFVNSRYIKSPLLIRAVEEGYKNQIMIGKFPTACLNIEINPSLVDINVHPTKLEVKFSNESEVYRTVYNAVKEALYAIRDVPEIKRGEDEKPAFVADKAAEPVSINFEQSELIQKETVKPAASYEEKPQVSAERLTEADLIEEYKKLRATETVKNRVAEPKMFEIKADINEEKEPEKHEELSYHEIFEKNLKKARVMEEENKPLENSEEAAKSPEPAEEVQEINDSVPEKKEKITEFKLVGQLFDTYIIVEIDDKMHMIDQHAAHERLNYEDLLKKLSGNEVYSQAMLIPSVVSLDAKELAVFEENAEFIKSIGFAAEVYGSNSVIIREVPTSAVSEDVESLFVEILSQLEENRREIITEKRQRLLYTIACKAAIKANHHLDKCEQEQLVRDVLSLESINTCPHGRPIMISMSKKEIEKEFKRIV